MTFINSRSRLYVISDGFATNDKRLSFPVDLVNVGSDSLSFILHTPVFSVKQLASDHSLVENRRVLSAHYIYTRIYECARFQSTLHARITRNDRLERFPLTLALSFLSPVIVLFFF